MNIEQEYFSPSYHKSFKNFLNKLFLFFLLIYSGGSVWFFRSELGSLSLFLLSVLLCIINNVAYSRKFLISIGLWFIYFICATFAIGSFHPLFMIEIPITMLAAYVVIQIFHVRTVDLFITFVYYLTAISLVFYSIQLLIPQILIPILHTLNLQGDIFFSTTQDCGSILIYSYNIIEGSTIMRNSGFCWEPGAFACFGIMAFFMNTFIRGQKFTKINLILLLGVLSTFSTTGYFLLFCLGIIYLFLHKNIFGKIIIIPSILCLGYIFAQSDFMWAKISQQYQDIAAWEELIDHSIAYDGHYMPGRFVSLRFALEDFKLRPIFGFAGNASLTYATQQGASIAIISGIGTIIARYGLFGLLSWLYLLYVSGCFCDKIKKEPIGKLYLVWIFMNVGIAISYKLLFSPFFFIFIFLPLYIPQMREDTSVLCVKNGKKISGSPVHSSPNPV